ncbi:MAG: PEP-utilizing enzyme [Candidatus Woesearchaeota archaeon]
MILKGSVVVKPHNNIIEGIAYVDPFCENLPNYPSEKILICKRVNLDYIEKILQFKCVVTSFGGLLSHASIIFRELNFPSIVGVENADTVIKTGDKLVINFEDGTIQVHEGGE